MKAKTPVSKAERLIVEEASEWFVDFRVGDADAAARERFDEWLRRSPQHIRAYMDIATTYVGLPPLELGGKTEVDALIACARSSDNVVHLNPGERVGESASMSAETSHDGPEARKVMRHRHGRRRLLAAACALIVAASATVLWERARYRTYATDIGERRSVTLADGSTVDLNARSKLRIEFTADERNVELLEGQALFQVAKDPNRPLHRRKRRCHRACRRYPVRRVPQIQRYHRDGDRRPRRCVLYGGVRRRRYRGVPSRSGTNKPGVTATLPGLRRILPRGPCPRVIRTPHRPTLPISRIRPDPRPSSSPPESRSP